MLTINIPSVFSKFSVAAYLAQLLSFLIIWHFNKVAIHSFIHSSNHTYIKQTFSEHQSIQSDRINTVRYRNKNTEALTKYFL